MKGPLSGIKVLELATFIAAPVTTRLLADMGAEVIKVEPAAGDGWRPLGINYVPTRFQEDENPVFDIYNTGKKMISLNLKTAEGTEAFHKLLAQSDVFVTNTRPAALKRLGLSYEDLKERYPQLIYAIVLGFGEKGPDAKKAAFDTTAFWSRSGFLRDMAVNEEGYQPVSAPASVGDTATGFLLLSEITAALYNRTKTGKGDYVSSTLYHNGIFCMGTMAVISQPPFGRTYPMTRAEYGPLSGSYLCSDGEWIFLNRGTKPLSAFFEMLGRPELAQLPCFQNPNTPESKVAGLEVLKPIFLTKTAEEWLRLSDEYDFPTVRMTHFKDIAYDPQANANGFVEKVTFPTGNTDVVPTSPIEMGCVTPPPTTPVPTVGADTAEVLKQLGYSDETLKNMNESGAIRMG